MVILSNYKSWIEYKLVDVINIMLKRFKMMCTCFNAIELIDKINSRVILKPK